MKSEHWMRRAFSLARNARGQTSPNPTVGAVLVKDGRLVGEGFHQKAGAPHAEIEALQKAGKEARDSILYINLEPCVHHGKTPPCTEALIQAKIKKVVTAALDPNPKVNGKGVQALQAGGIEVEVGFLEQEARKLNEAFFKWIVHGLPFVILKFAVTLDGKIAASSGDSHWITGEESRARAREMRSWSDAIVVGVNTILKDNPRLEARISNKKNPARVILDSSLRVPLEAQVIQTAEEIPTWIAAVHKDEKKQKALETAGVQVFYFSEKEGKVDLLELCRFLGRREITGLFVEGGARVHGSFLKAGLADKIAAFIAPTIMGEGIGPIQGWGVDSLSAALRLHDIEFTEIKDDILIEGYL